jgi:hypothetical protein
MMGDRYPRIASALSLALLVTQVALSIVIVWRLFELEKSTTSVVNEVGANPRSWARTFVNGVSTDDDPHIGPKGAPITIVAFEDFMCPACAARPRAGYLGAHTPKISIIHCSKPISYCAFV